MKLQILKSNGDAVLDFNSNTANLDDETSQKIESLNKEIVESYTINFNNNVTLEETHDIDTIKSHQIESIIVKLR